MNSKNLIGQRFGRLTVVSEAPRGEKYPHQKWYRCRCDCGNEIATYTNALTSGSIRSCGCLQRESRFTDITGEVRGYLTAIRPTGEVRNGSAVWEWRCTCGKIIQATEQNVGSTGRTSCGCMRRPLNIEQAKHMQSERKKFLVDGTDIRAIESDKIARNNTSGVRGVCWHNRLQRWQARITFKGQTIHLGYFRTIDDAAKARARAEENLFSPAIESWNVQPPQNKQISPAMNIYRTVYGRFSVYFRYKGNRCNVGTFDSLPEAIAARDKKRAELGLPPIPHE